jgi:hypothetical protein
MTKRCAIVGTASSWKSTPWNDPTLEIWGLNDCYSLGFPRIDRHYELHPIAEMHFYPKDQPIKKSELPTNKFLRPMGHLEWLRAQAATIPVFLQDDPPADWPVNAKRFPIEQVERAFGTYWASGPSYMLAHAVLEGYTEVAIYGIHLATEAEYREQRANFEHLIGVARGLGVTVTMADESPLLKHPWRYAYDPKPVAPPNPYRDELKATLKAIDQLVRALVHWPVGQDKTDALERLARLEIVELDCRQQLAKASMGGTLVIPALAA